MRANRAGRATGRAIAAALAVGLVVAGCASGDESSFRSLDDASAQAKVWIDTAITAAVPGASTDGHVEGPDSCTSSADFAETSYSLSVDVPADEVDATTLAVWQSLRDQGFWAFPDGGGAAAPDGPPGTTPVPPGPGVPSWILFTAQDGFRVELIGARTEPTYVSAYIVTPCLRTG